MVSGLKSQKSVGVWVQMRASSPPRSMQISNLLKSSKLGVKLYFIRTFKTPKNMFVIVIFVLKTEVLDVIIL